MTATYRFVYWLLFFAVLANIDLGLSVAGVPLNLQRLLFATVAVLIVLDAGLRQLDNLFIPKYSVIVLAVYSLLFMMELYHSIRLHAQSVIPVQYIMTLFLVIALALMKRRTRGVSLNFNVLSLAFLTVVLASILLTSDIAHSLQSIVLEGKFYNSMRLRSEDARNIVNSWAAGIVVGFVLFSDIGWQHARSETNRRLWLLALGSIAALVTLLSASRAALALFAVAILLIGLREIRRGGKLGIISATLIWGSVVFISIDLLQSSAMFLRLSDLLAGQDASALQRISAFSAVAESAYNAFLFGHGQALSTAEIAATENTLLGLTHRYGVLGLLLYLTLWVVVFLRVMSTGVLSGYFNSVVVTFASLLTNDLLFFPVGLFVVIEALDYGRVHDIDDIRIDNADGSAFQT